LSNLSSHYFWIGSALLLLAFGIVLAGIDKGWFDSDRVRVQSRLLDASDNVSGRESPTGDHLARVLGINKDDLVEVGGVTRPATDLSFDSAITESSESPKSPLPSPGHAPFLKGNENVQVAGLVRELSVPQGPEAAMSTFFKPEEFDLAAYQQNPGQYLNRIRPGRVFYPAQPGPDVKPLESNTKPFQSVLQGEKVILKVKAAPGNPVTFYTPGVGVFDNRLSSFSTQAGDDGIATAIYTAGPGTIGLQNILAASPVHSGQIRFRVNVSLKD
jgi:hypothetical protein